MSPRVHRRRGSSVLEFAIGSGVLLAAFSGTFRFGYTFIQYNKLQTAVAQAAHYAATVPYDSPNSTPSAGYVAAARNMVLYGNPSGGGNLLLRGLTASHVAVAVTFTNRVPSAVTVSIQGYTIDALFGQARLVAKPKATYPYHGIWTPL